MTDTAKDAEDYWCPGCEAVYKEKPDTTKKHPQIRWSGQVLAVRKCLPCVITDLHQSGKGTTK